MIECVFSVFSTVATDLKIFHLTHVKVTWQRWQSRRVFCSPPKKQKKWGIPVTKTEPKFWKVIFVQLILKCKYKKIVRKLPLTRSSMMSFNKTTRVCPLPMHLYLKSVGRSPVSFPCPTTHPVPMYTYRVAQK